MINTEFGRMVAFGFALFAFVFFMGYLRLRWEATHPKRKRAALQTAVPARRLP